ncbi:MAG TPA: ABC transporter permease [Candidatus Sulfotelmatobacter sp.]|nr:ABC transporter permease [Candidatus Sulfotelmatobacter sp.]
MISRLRVLSAKFRHLFAKENSREQHDLEVDEEIRQHLQQLADRYAAQGMSRGDALAAARRQFGNLNLHQEDRRETQSVHFLETLWRDVMYGTRQLRRNPLFTTVAIATLAIGIGANTAVFTLLDQLVLRLLPVKDPSHLVMIWPDGSNFGNNNGQRPVSYPFCNDLRKSPALESVMCQYNTWEAVTIDGSTESLNVELVSGNYFDTLGVKAAIGRVFTSATDDQVYSGHPSIVLSYRFWQERFGGDPKIVGKKILVNNYPMQIVGVSAAGFAGVDPARSPHMRIPLLMLPVLPVDGESLVDRRTQWLHAFARLAPGFTDKSARAALQPLFRQSLETESTDPQFSKISPYDRALFFKRTLAVEIASNGFSDMRGQFSTALVVLMSMAGLILLVACSNVASLMVSRAAARQKEIAVRLAIGAGRWTLIRSLLVESLMLAGAGVVLGLLLSEAAIQTLLAMMPSEGQLVMLHAQPDMRILMFSIAVALATGLLFGLAPALQGTRLDVWSTLKDAAIVSGGRSARMRKILVTAQVALSFLLLVGAGLFTKTLYNLKNTSMGMKNIDNLVTFGIDPRGARYNGAQAQILYRNALSQIRTTPGVTSAAFSVVPLLQGYNWSGSINIVGREIKDGEDLDATNNIISPEYFKTMGIPLIAGRDFNDQDRYRGPDPDKMPTVCIVNRTFAEHFFGKQNALGHYAYSIFHEKTPVQIVGVVENSVYRSPREEPDRREIYFAEYEAPMVLQATFYVRASSASKALFPTLRSIIANLDPSLPVFQMKTLDTQLDEVLNTERLIASLSIVFGAVATALAALGLYGVVAFSVASRTKEIGVRMALGARKTSVLWLILRETMILVTMGIAIGVPAAYVLSRYVTSQLYGVSPTDVSTGLAALAILAAVAAFSGFVPARRASSIDPLTALRHE